MRIHRRGMENAEEGKVKYGRRLTQIMVMVGFCFLIGVVGAEEAIPTLTPPSEEEEGFNLLYIVLLAIIVVSGILLLTGKKKGAGEEDSGEKAWWATKGGQQFLITLLLLVLTVVGLVYVGFEVLVAAGFLFAAWLAYKHFLADASRAGAMHTYEVADRIADEYRERTGYELDAREGVSAIVLYGVGTVGVQLIEINSPDGEVPTMVWEEDLATGRITGPTFTTLNEAKKGKYAMKELFIPAERGDKKPQISQIGTEGEE